MQTIELRTSQHVTIEYELATLGERILALLIDIVAVVGGYLLLLLFFYAAFGTGRMDGSPASSFFLPFGLFILYHFFFELLTHGQSLGKKALSIQVVRADGQEPAPSDYLLRALMHFVDTFGTAGILGGLMVSSTPQRQRLGDLMAGTAVIKVKIKDRFTLSDILRISSLDDYEPTFPAVRQFSEADMLMIKNTIARYQLYNNLAHRRLIFDLAHRLAEQLDTSVPRGQEIEFLKTLIRDYIVLTR
ncbi:MAG: RDD family protein [Lewinella sp.]|nr:RDD family protein [Lewinella sp.]